MISRKNLTLLISLFLVAAAGLPEAEAGRKQVGVNPAVTGAFDGGTSSPLAVTLPNVQDNGQDPGFTVPFMIPKGYRKNSPIKVTLSYVSSSTTLCGDYVVVGEGSLRFRTGEAFNLFLPTDGGTMEPADGSELLPSQGGFVAEKTYVVSPDAALPFQKGDMLQMFFIRAPLDVDDTCGDTLTIVALRVEYRTK